MKTAVVLALLFCAAFAAPAEELKAGEGAGGTPEEQVVVVPDAVEEAPEEEVGVAKDLLSEEAAPDDARFNSCPPGWFFHGSHCFLLVRSPKTWFSAEEDCNSMGAHLASATNPREYSFLQQMTATGQQSYAWLGGFYLQGKWLWISQGMYYENWYNKLSPDSSNSCIYLRTTTGWRNNSCNGAFSYICAKNPFTC